MSTFTPHEIEQIAVFSESDAWSKAIKQLEELYFREFKLSPDIEDKLKAVAKMDALQDISSRLSAIKDSINFEML